MVRHQEHSVQGLDQSSHSFHALSPSGDVKHPWRRVAARGVASNTDHQSATVNHGSRPCRSRLRATRSRRRRLRSKHHQSNMVRWPRSTPVLPRGPHSMPPRSPLPMKLHSMPAGCRSGSRPRPPRSSRVAPGNNRPALVKRALQRINRLRAQQHLRSS
jgi:hypothetical protein